MAPSPRRSFLARVGLGLIAFLPAAKALVGKVEAKTETPATRPQTGILSSSASALVPQPPTPPPHPTTLKPDPRFSEGVALKVGANQIVINSLQEGNVTINLTGQTDFWDGRWVKDQAASAGDTITAWGQRMPDGSLNALKLYVNIKNVIGSVAGAVGGAAPLTFTVNDKRQQGHPVSIKLDPRTLVAHRGSSKNAVGTAGVQLTAGEQIQVIGRQAGGTLLATDVYLPS